jgi:carbamoyl-phosphate synthase large subunit
MIRVLFTGGGRRVSLLRAFRTSAQRLGESIELHVGDADLSAAACEISDTNHLLPLSREPTYIEQIVAICAKAQIDMVIPLIDPELPVLAEHREEVETTGARLVLSQPETIRIAADKLATHKHFAACGIPTPRTWDASEIPTDIKFPVIVKPRFGSGSVGVFEIHTSEQLEFFARYVDQACVQEKLSGDEFTFDVYVDGAGDVRCVIPRLRLETRAGEISKGITILDPELIDMARRVALTLPGAFGPLNMQAFRADTGDLSFIEVNPRFAGGYLLSHRAGADFPGALISSVMRGEIADGMFQPQTDVVMLRFDDELITNRSTLESRGVRVN